MLAFNHEAMVVVITTFLAAAACLYSTMFCAYVVSKHDVELQTLYAVNGVIMGLIIITPLAGLSAPRARSSSGSAAVRCSCWANASSRDLPGSQIRRACSLGTSSEACSAS